MKKIIPTTDEAKKFLKEKGLTMCDDQIYIAGKQAIKCINNEGYIVMARLNDLRKMTTPRAFNKGNPYTLDNIKHYIKLNNIDIKLKDGQKYNGKSENLIFICKKHGEFEKCWNALQGGQHCPICNKSINKLYDGNRLSALRPDLIKYFVNPEDANNYTVKSAKKALLKCPNCGKERYMNIYHLSNRRFSCPNCDDGISIPEKFCRAILNQLNLNYDTEKVFNWASNKKYDFFIENKYIIECHGIQHYDKGFSKLSGKSVRLENENDNQKYDLAIKNKILPENYIVIDCRYSDFEYLKMQFKNSLYNYFDLSNINWEDVNTFCLNSISIEAIKLWNNGIQSTNQIGYKLKVSASCVRNYLKKGAESNLCDYTIEEAKRIAYKKTRRKPNIVLQFDLKGDLIREYSSVKEAIKHTGASYSGISTAVSKNKPYYNCIWKYKTRT